MSIFFAIGSDGEINMRVNHMLLETEGSGLLYEESLYPQGLVPMNTMMGFIAYTQDIWAVEHFTRPICPFANTGPTPVRCENLKRQLKESWVILIWVLILSTRPYHGISAAFMAKCTLFKILGYIFAAAIPSDNWLYLNFHLFLFFISAVQKDTASKFNSLPTVYWWTNNMLNRFV